VRRAEEECKTEEEAEVKQVAAAMKKVEKKWKAEGSKAPKTKKSKGKAKEVEEAEAPVLETTAVPCKM
jgi:hypothetical protein